MVHRAGFAPEAKTVQIMSQASLLAARLRDEIRSGRYAFGDKLPTERELVGEAGLSRGTVRKALAILEAERLIVRQHGRGAFVADPVHTRLASSEAALIGMLTYEREYYFERVIQSASARASERGYAMATGIGSSEKLETQHVTAFISNHVRGAIFAPRGQTIEENYQRLVAEGLPVVLLDTLIPGCEEDYVVVDNRLGTRLAVEHLAELGHRRIAYIGHNNSSDVPCRSERLRGYQEGCAELGLGASTDRVVECSIAEAKAQIARVLRRRRRPTAFVAYNDAWAIQVLEAATDLGIPVPAELSVTGFDDSVMAAHSHVPITSVNPEHRELGIAAVDLLIESIENPRARPKRGLLVNPRLVVRQSTARPSDAVK